MAEAKFFSPPESWTLMESEWKFSKDPQYIDGTESDAGINRVFVLNFPDRSAKDQFFADEQYREI